MAGLQAIAAFAETVRRGGFARAGRELGLSPSAVAKSVARLESDLGVRLLHRTTRQVTLTGDGDALYERCRRIVDEMEAMRADAEGVRGEPSGTLRINAPMLYGRTVIMPIFARLAGRHPRLGFDLSFSDRFVDVIRDGLDAVIRIGTLPDSTLVAHPFDSQQIVVLGAPSYLRDRAPPQRPSDLATHECLAFRLPSSGRFRPWQFKDGRRPVDIVPNARFVLDDGESLVSAAIQGMGLVQVPDNMAVEALRAGRLVEILAPFRTAPMPIAIVYPSNRNVTPKLRAVIDALVGLHAKRRRE